MDASSAPGRPHTTEAKAGPHRSERMRRSFALFLLVFSPTEAAQ